MLMTFLSCSVDVLVHDFGKSKLATCSCFAMMFLFKFRIKPRFLAKPSSRSYLAQTVLTSRLESELRPLITDH